MEMYNNTNNHHHQQQQQHHYEGYYGYEYGAGNQDEQNVDGAHDVSRTPYKTAKKQQFKSISNRRISLTGSLMQQQPHLESSYVASGGPKRAPHHGFLSVRVSASQYYKRAYIIVDFVEAEIVLAFSNLSGQPPVSLSFDSLVTVQAEAREEFMLEFQDLSAQTNRWDFRCEDIPERNAWVRVISDAAKIGETLRNQVIPENQSRMPITASAESKQTEKRTEENAKHLKTVAKRLYTKEIKKQRSMNSTSMRQFLPPEQQEDMPNREESTDASSSVSMNMTTKDSLSPERKQVRPTLKNPSGSASAVRPKSNDKRRRSLLPATDSAHGPDLLLSGAVDPDFQLPKTVLRMDGEFRGEKIAFVIIGVVHIDPISRIDVRKTIEAIKPNSVVVEVNDSQMRELLDTRKKHERPLNYCCKVYASAPCYCVLWPCLCCFSSFRYRVSEQIQKMVDVKLAFAGTGFGFELIDAVEATNRVGAYLVLSGSNDEDSENKNKNMEFKVTTSTMTMSSRRRKMPPEVEVEFLELLEKAGFVERHESVKDFFKNIGSQTDVIEAIMDAVRAGDLEVMLASQLLELLLEYTQNVAKTQFLHALHSQRIQELANSLLYRAYGRIRVCVCEVSQMVSLLSEMEEVMSKDDENLTLEAARNLLERAVETGVLKDALDACEFFANHTDDAETQNFIMKSKVDGTLSRCLRLYLGDNRDSAERLCLKILEVIGDLVSYPDNVMYYSLNTSQLDVDVSHAIVSFSKSKLIAMEGCYLLGNLATLADNAAHMVSRRSHCAILNSMRRWERDSDVLEAGSFAILSLSKCDSDVRACLVDDGVMEVLQFGLDRFPEKPVLVRDAIDSIANLVGTSGTRNKQDFSSKIRMPLMLSEPNRLCLKQMRMIINKGITPLDKLDGDIAIVSSNCMVRLSFLRNNPHQLVEMGVPETMMQLLAMGGDIWQIQVNCSLVMSELCKVREVKNSLIRGGIYDVLSNLPEIKNAANSSSSTNPAGRVRKEIENLLKALKSKDDVFEVLVASAGQPSPDHHRSYKLASSAE